MAELAFQTGQILNGFMAIEEKLQKLIFAGYANPHEDEDCRCGLGKRIAQCDGCFQYPPSCISCFISHHRYNPFHWVLLWDHAKRYWRKCEYTDLSEDCAVQLGHAGECVTCPWSKSAIRFRVIHTNGVHTTKLRFCGCLAAPDKLTQLMHAKLFPGTPSDPRSAYTFAVLKEFHMHNLQSKCGAFDYIVSLRRLTDNVFTNKVPVSQHYIILTGVFINRS